MMKLTSCRISFIRNLKRVPSFYLRVKIGDREYKEDLAFDEEDGTCIDTYPLKVYCKKETEMDIFLDIKDFYGKDYYGD